MGGSSGIWTLQDTGWPAANWVAYCAGHMVVVVVVVVRVSDRCACTVRATSRYLHDVGFGLKLGRVDRCHAKGETVQQFHSEGLQQLRQLVHAACGAEKVASVKLTHAHKAILRGGVCECVREG